jgi:hypothetical protein
MFLRKLFPTLTIAAVLVMGGASMAADYRADEFLGLDLSTAILSPKPLGPPTEFAPVPLEAKSDIANMGVAKSDTAKTAKTDAATTDAVERAVAKPGRPKSDVATIDHAAAPARAKSEHKPLLHRATSLAHLGVERPRGAARIKLAHRHGNPFDAQARDTRYRPHPIQAWPCNSGGICNWKQ